jgi:hypothetical protein
MIFKGPVRKVSNGGYCRLAAASAGRGDFYPFCVEIYQLLMTEAGG